MFCGYSISEYYMASPDWVKAVWVLSFPAFIVAMSGVLAWYRVNVLRLRPAPAETATPLPGPPSFLPDL